MPLTEKAMRSVVKTLTYVDEPKRWRAFNAMLDNLNLQINEVESEFARVEAALRYVAETTKDRAALGRVHMHKMSCRVQAFLSCRHFV